MTQSELDNLLKKDLYHIPRKKPSDVEQRLLLREVGYHCPICGKDLQSRTQQKRNHKNYQIAHIYPNRPTIEQYALLHNLERLGKTSEDSDNLIALCLQCHSEQDYHTTKEDYEKLLSVKKGILERNALHDAISELSLEKELVLIVNEICKPSFTEQIQLNMKPVKVVDKFEEKEALLLSKISGYITQYYTFLRDLFKEHDGKNGFVFDTLCYEMKAAFVKMDTISKEKEFVFNQLVGFIQNKTGTQNQTACEVIASFFVQNCEVFNETSR